MKVVNVVPVDQDWSCPICLNSMSQVNEIANPEVCNHHFCLKCLLEWSQTNTSCPLDRMDFRIIFVKNAVGGAIQRRVRTPQRDLRADVSFFYFHYYVPRLPPFSHIFLLSFS